MIDEKKKDKHATICKDCLVKIKTTNNESICTCSCERCVDGKIIKTAFSAVELLLSRMENGLELADEMLTMIASLAYTAGVLCENCERELANK
jgi:hypothetical protein